MQQERSTTDVGVADDEPPGRELAEHGAPYQSGLPPAQERTRLHPHCVVSADTPRPVRRAHRASRTLQTPTWAPHTGLEFAGACSVIGVTFRSFDRAIKASVGKVSIERCGASQRHRRRRGTRWHRLTVATAFVAQNGGSATLASRLLERSWIALRRCEEGT